MRQVFIDTETTGLHASSGDRIIEIGAIELVGRERTGRELHHYLQPDRPIDEGATKVHGITDEQLVGCPRFADIADELVEFLRGAELVAHNAPFDVGFLDAELARLDGYPLSSIEEVCKVRDTLRDARRKHPGTANSLDALCLRYNIDISHRELHGALKDASLLADLYLAMTGGQMGLFVAQAATRETAAAANHQTGDSAKDARPAFVVQLASQADIEEHESFLTELDAHSSSGSIWRRLTASQLTGIQQSQEE